MKSIIQLWFIAAIGAIIFQICLLKILIQDQDWFYTFCIFGCMVWVSYYIIKMVKIYKKLG